MVFSNGVTLMPGQHLVIYADAKPESGPLHAPFILDAAGDHVVLAGLTERGARYVIDSVSFGAQGPDMSLARLGCGGPWVASVPTPWAGNVSGPWKALVQSNTFLLAYPTRPGNTYTVEFKDHLNAPAWTALSPVQGIGLEQTVQQPVGTSRFYRVREQ